MENKKEIPVGDLKKLTQEVAKKNAEREAMRQCLRTMEEMLPEVVAFRMNSFKEHKRQGFSDDQALTLCVKLLG